MTPAYINVVLETFKLKKQKQDLWVDLHNPTPANLKRSCLKICAGRYDRKDGRILQQFFGEGDDKEDLIRIIQRVDPEDFRAVQNFLQGETSGPREKTVELGAWLIDFRPRPYNPTVDYELLLEQTKQAIVDGLKDLGNKQNVKQRNQFEEVSEMSSVNFPHSTSGVEFSPSSTEDSSEISIKSEEISLGGSVGVDPARITDNGGKSEPESPNPPELSQKKKVRIIIVLVTMAIIITGFLFYKNRQPKTKKDIAFGLISPVRPQACMVWSGDHYERIPCDHRYDDSLAIPLDSVVLRKFKMITNPESISIKDMGKIWYAKHNNKVEYFTDSGNHPVNKKTLKRLTDRIYIYHIVPLRDSLTR